MSRPKRQSPAAAESISNDKTLRLAEKIAEKLKRRVCVLDADGKEIQVADTQRRLDS
jgi:hypothetical protein